MLILISVPKIFWNPTFLQAYPDNPVPQPKSTTGVSRGANLAKADVHLIGER
ncbi:MAG: hypothetical protein P8M50_06145 [Paracoccaceae bacterium]|nr:hypothetical protein [Paracoccaceae bacterium]